MENSKNQVFNEKDSLKIIQEMIQVSQKKIKNDGILIMIWGYAMSIMYLISYIKDVLFISAQWNKLLGRVNSLLPVFALVYSIYYIAIQRKKVKTYIGVSLRYIWLTMFVCLVLINLIQFNVMHEINFMLQHPVFMVVIAFATVVTGIMLRYNLIIGGGVIFAILALISSYMALRDQLLIEAIAWIIAFIIPGHIMFLKRKL